MYSGSDDNVSLLNLLEGMLLSDSKQLHIIPSNSLAQRRPLANSPQVWVSLNFGNVRLQVAISIGIGVCEIDLIVVVGKCVLPGKRVVRFVLERAPTVPIFVVVDVLTAPVPTQVLLLWLFLTVNYYLHPHSVQTVLLVLVQDVELYFLVLTSVRYLKKKPLRVPVRVYVVLQQQVVLPVW